MGIDLIDVDVGLKADTYRKLPGGADKSPQLAAGRGVPDNAAQNNFFAGDVDWFTLHLFGQTTDGDELPVWGSRVRDQKLREVVRDSATLLSGVVYGETTRVKNMPWVISGPSAAETRRWNTILKTANFGLGLQDLLQKFARDYLTQDNGAFIEIVTKAGRAGASQPLRGFDDILGIASMDSGQCYRTIDPQYPVVYHNPYTNEWTVYHWSKIIYRASFPEGLELARNIGFCAVSRTFAYARLARETNTYLYEKIRGQEPEIAFISGISQKQLKNAFATGTINSQLAGQTRFKGTLFVAPSGIGPSMPPVHSEIVGVKSVPDGWEHETELRLAIACLALGFGLDPRELWLSTTAGATKADAEVQHKKASSKGRSDLLLTLQTIINDRLLPEDVIFRFDQKDDQEDWLAERVRMSRARRFDMYVKNEFISPEEGRVILASTDDIPRSLSPNTMDNVMTSLPSDNTLDVGDFDVPTPEDKREEARRMAQEIAGQVNANGADYGQPAPSEDDEEDQPKSKKGLGGTQRFFRQALIELIKASPQRNLFRTLLDMNSIIEAYGRMAFADGLREGGIEATLDTIPQRYQGLIQNILGEHLSYTGKFIAQSGTPELQEKLIGQVDDWVNNTLESFYVVGRMAGAPEQLFAWELGPTEHCETCLFLDGVKLTGADWLALGILPRSTSLVCTGIKCQCSLEEAEGVADPLPMDVPLRSGHGPTPMYVEAGRGLFERIFARFRQ